MIVKCNTCNTEFHRKPSHVNKNEKQYCSKKCTIRSVLVVCNTCGKQITREPHRINKKNIYYCDNECKNNKPKTGETVRCKNCDKAIYRQKSDINLTGLYFCTQKCNWDFHRQKHKVECVVCKDSFNKPPAEQKRYPIHCCSVECRSKYNDKRQKIPCKQCNKIVFRPPSLFVNRDVFCSEECHNIFQDHKTQVVCDKCGDSTRKSPCHMKMRHHFCSANCFSSYVFEESFVETEFETLLKKLNVSYIRNDNNTIINSKTKRFLELDFYLPELKFAVEINGSTHYNPVYGEEALAATKSRDSQKRKKCKELGIILRVIKPGNCKLETYLPRYKKVISEIKKLIKQYGRHNGQEIRTP